MDAGIQINKDLQEKHRLALEKGNDSGTSFAETIQQLETTRINNNLELDKLEVIIILFTHCNYFCVILS